MTNDDIKAIALANGFNTLEVDFKFNLWFNLRHESS